MTRNIVLPAIMPSKICVTNDYDEMSFKEQAFEIFKYLIMQPPSGTFDEFKNNFEAWYKIFNERRPMDNYDFETYNPPAKKERDCGCP